MDGVSDRERGMGWNRALLVLAVFTFVTLATSLPAAAAEQTAMRKAGRGLAGMTLGVLEVPGNIAKVSRERGAGWGWTLGFVEGLGMIVVRTLVGTYELVTAPLEAPPGYVAIIEPEFPWTYFEEPPRKLAKTTP
jgi:putative exosortase-associated protein (TIGR04073 family)